MQTPLQLALPGQVPVQAPLAQAVVLLQAVSAAPQLLESESRLTQDSVLPSALKNWPMARSPGQLVEHLPFTQA